MAAAARCSETSEEQPFHERSQSSLVALRWGFWIEGRGGWSSGRSQSCRPVRLERGCLLARRKGNKKIENASRSGSTLSPRITFERKREQERERVGGRNKSLFSFFPSPPPLQPPFRPPWASRYASCRSSGATTGSNACFHARRKRESKKKKENSPSFGVGRRRRRRNQKPLLPLSQGLSKLLGDAAPTCRRENKFENYFGRQIAVDASMHIYQFLVKRLFFFSTGGHRSVLIVFELVCSPSLSFSRSLPFLFFETNQVVVGRMGDQQLTDQSGEVTR